MVRILFTAVLLLSGYSARAQGADDWSQLRQYGYEIGVDSLSTKPDSVCLARFATEIVYGRTPRRMSYQGIPAFIDTLRIGRLTHQLLSRSNTPRSIGARYWIRSNRMTDVTGN